MTLTPSADPAERMRWLRAAWQGIETRQFAAARAAAAEALEATPLDPPAQFLLGMAFDKGDGVPQDWIQAETWLILATSQAGARERDYWARIRDAVAQKLTLDQLAEARRRAYFWAMPVHRGGAFSARF